MNQTVNPPTPAICREFPATSVAADRRGTDNRMTVTHVTNIRTEELIAVAAAQDDEQQQAASLALSHGVVPTGEVIVNIDGDLDIATTETAVSYVRDVIDHHRGPVIVNLAGLEFCDARGLSALLRMANHADQAGCSFMLASPSPPLVKLMRITGLDRRLLPSG
jgi:anti-sigma B factor antagonist